MKYFDEILNKKKDKIKSKIKAKDKKKLKQKDIDQLILRMLEDFGYIE